MSKEQMTFINDEGGEETFYVQAETTLGGVSYLLVTETEDLTRILDEKQVGDSLLLSLWREEKDGEGGPYEVEIVLVDVSDIY